MNGTWSSLVAGASAAMAVTAFARVRAGGMGPRLRPGGHRPEHHLGSARRAAQPWRPHLEPRARRRWRLAVTIGLAAVALCITPALAALVLGGAAARWHRAHRRAERRQAHLVAAALPDVVDLLLLCTSAGVALPAAQVLVADRTEGALADALRAAEESAQAGRSRADCLVEALTPLGERAVRLAHVLVDHLRYGVALGPALERLGAELKLDRRRRAEEEARRVPVRLLGPLVACILPAFGLLTVVPLLAASLKALPR